MDAVRSWITRHPYLAMWLALAIVMVVLVLVLGPTQGALQARELAVILVATVLLAGLCVWIISWE